MFFVKDQRHGSTFLVFTGEDPRKDGYKGGEIEHVELDYDMEAVHSWPDGQARPEVCVGRDPNNPKHYKVFKYESELRSTGYQLVPGTLVTPGSWARYLRLHLIPPNPDLTDEEWFDYLDRLDEDWRRRRQLVEEPLPPREKSRDEVAAWVARTHFLADSSIQEVWYLPQGAPPDEIRLLELSDRLGANGSKVEAIDFGLDVEGTPFRLVVADITSEQLNEIKNDPACLPANWSLDRNTVWRRRA